MKTRKLLRLFFIMMLTLALALVTSSCSIDSDQNYAKKRAKSILACFDSKDTDTLKSMFSAKAQSEYDLDAQIQNAFDKYVGQSTEYEFILVGPAGEQSNGEWIDKHIVPTLNGIKTDSNKTYRITYFEYLVYNDDETEVGISSIVLKDMNNNVLAEIGG